MSSALFSKERKSIDFLSSEVQILLLAILYLLLLRSAPFAALSDAEKRFDESRDKDCEAR